MYLWFRGSGTTFGGDEPMVDMFISDITEGTTDLDYLMALADRGSVLGMDVYKNHGYFAPETADSLKSAARQCTVEYPPSTCGTLSCGMCGEDDPFELELQGWNHRPITPRLTSVPRGVSSGMSVLIAIA